MAATTGKSKKERNEEGENVAEDVIVCLPSAVHQQHAINLATHSKRVQDDSRLSAIGVD